jgi:Big-like domain-containing protein
MRGWSRSVIVVAVTSLVALAAPSAMAGPSGSCTQNAPRATIANNWSWGSPGSWGYAGQKLTYAVGVFNNDTGCGSSTFEIGVSAPEGFTVSIPTPTITLKSSSTGYLTAYVTSPDPIANGDYPVTAWVQRSGTASLQSFMSPMNYYKVYSADSTAPRLYWMNPENGSVITGRSTYVNVSSTDDHAVQRIDITLDGVLVASRVCDDITYDCQASYKWSMRRAQGEHVATFAAVDWMGNASSTTSTFTVS